MTARGPQELDDLDAVFDALVHEARRTILSILHARGGRMTSGEIAARFEHSWPTTTRHLGILRRSGLVRVEVAGREHIYQLDTARLDAVAGRWISRFGPTPSGSAAAAG